MSRSYKGIRAKKNRVYSVEDLMRLYKVSANTVSNWVRAGLRPSDTSKPYVFLGAVVTNFHKERRARSRKNLRAGEFKCGGCKLAVFPDLDTVFERKLENGKVMLFAECPECPSRPVKIPSQRDLALLAQHRNPKTTVDWQHEEITPAPGGIGIDAKKNVLVTGSENDRVVYKWQTYAGRFEERTIDQHLAAIRFCKETTHGKPFGQFTTADAARIRETLKQSLQAQDYNRKSKSTVAHTASQLVAFFKWLRKQDGFKRLPQDISEYFKLPKSAYAKSLPRRSKAYPSLKEAEALMMGMPSRSHMDRRARAIFALAFIGALRADTLVSLRIEHVDISARRIIQDASVLRAKNGKSLNICWFPVPESFVEVVTEWVALLRSEGFKDKDPLFPDAAWLTGSKDPKAMGRDIILPMSTAQAVTEAFAIASRTKSEKYSPHSAKHTIAAERDKRSLTQEQRKAWSENMGHETEQITQSHYGKLSEDRRMQLFEEILANKAIEFTTLSDAEKAKLFDAIVDNVFA
ncbi:site-specific integrase [Roseobacter sp. YSTF-M11]|uniref:Site-specific integrase n=1 Tax=Roseobacter insulae TaxID=2859783 RepID=A0A9X1K3T1_9RHOB|nr:site-specific integrase [Roseobacter insulae]MBW4709858.1 site-specific integrase [Roseobacter insulae]